MENIAIKVENDDLTSSEFNQIVNELETAVTSSNQALTSLDQTQISKGASVYSSRQNYTTDSGTANSYILTTASPYKSVPSYHDGMQIVFKPGNVNTGASTLNYNSLGSKSIKSNGNDLIGGELSDITTVQYDLANDWFEIVLVQNSIFFEDSKVRIQGFILEYSEYSGNSLDFSSQDVNTLGFAIKSDGLAAYACGDTTTATVYQYTLTKPYDLSTGSYASKSLNISAQTTSPRGIAFKTDGSILYVLSNGGIVYAYNLSTAWDLNTGSYSGNSYNFSTDPHPPGLTFSSAEDITFSSDGAKMFLAVANPSFVVSVTLFTPWDITTALADGVGIDVSAQESLIQGCAISDDGKSVFVVGATNDTIYQYVLSTAFIISTAAYSGTFFMQTEDTDIEYVGFARNGEIMYTVGNASKAYQYFSNVLST